MTRPNILPFARPAPQDYASGYLDGLEDAKDLHSFQTWAFGFLAGAFFVILIALIVILFRS